MDNNNNNDDEDSDDGQGGEGDVVEDVVLEAASAGPWEGWDADTDVVSALEDVMEASVTAAAAAADAAAAAASAPFRALVVALRHNQQLPTIRTIVEAHPNVVTYTDGGDANRGWTIMHYVGFHSAPRDVVDYLAQKNKQAIKQRSAEGFTPILVACRSGASLATVVGLELAADLLTILTGLPKTPEGDSSLNLAVAHGAPHEVIFFLASRFTGLLNSPNNRGYVPLHSAAARHALIPGDPPPEDLVAVARTLTTLWPGALRARTGDGSLPMHIAAVYGELDMVVYLHGQYPEAMQERNDEDELPMHSAAWNGLLESAEWLADQDPASLRATSVGGYLPLHLAAQYNTSDVVEALVNRYPDGAHAIADDGSLPIHCAAVSGSRHTVRLLIERHPLGLRTRNAAGLLPLHVAMLNPRDDDMESMDVVYELARAWPLAITGQDEEIDNSRAASPPP